MSRPHFSSGDAIQFRPVWRHEENFKAFKPLSQTPKKLGENDDFPAITDAALTLIAKAESKKQQRAAEKWNAANAFKRMLS